MGKFGNFLISVAMVCHSLTTSTSNGSSQCIHVCQSFCRRSLARMVMGAARPIGSNILEESCNITKSTCTIIKRHVGEKIDSHMSLED